MSDDFSPNSRYRNVPLAIHTAPDGTQTPYVARRIIPAMERYRALERIRPESNLRIDDVAAQAYGDPEQYWRICDANGDAEPAEATKPEGRLLVIPLPLEVASDGNA
ncbi:hypothetical protein BTH42_32135 [Burkholderia sp. SRS-W-2-2016]|uniref:hypothetical protein n=1 Tax=Burkholderia sp. SRS-W-2-2016 TaxID=1926878 RepID=UPI00094B259A|nr:hypothetical protein [Burkholderia sp. SRS-W-2-2016]OLL27495.1 hypothetical protein BTH42_32135 [Burkholderia sp. SRS-W-2-2016]